MNLTQALQAHSLGTAIGYTFYFPYIAIGLTLLFFGIGAVSTKSAKNGVFASLVGNAIIWIFYPLIIPTYYLGGLFLLVLVGIALDIIFKHK